MNLKYKRHLLPILAVLFSLVLVAVSSNSCVGTTIAAQGWSGVGGSGDRLFYMYTVPSSGGFLGCGANPPQTQLVVLSSADGGKINTIPLSETTISYGTPVINGDFAYVTGYNGKVYKININSGGTPLSAALDQDRHGSIIGSVVIAGDRLFVSSTDNHLYALNASTLERIWSFATGDEIWSTPAVINGVVYVGSFDKKIYALDAATGQEKWSYLTDGAIVATPVVAGNRVYVASLDRHIYALDAGNGSLVWRFPTDGGEGTPKNWFWATPVLAGNDLYAPSTDGKIYIINAQTGAPAANPIAVGSSITSSPVIVGSKIIFVTEEGQIYTLDVATRQLVASAFSLRTVVPVQTPITANSAITTRAALSLFNNKVYIHTTNPERVFEFNPETGQAKEIGTGTSVVTLPPTSTGITTVVVTSVVTVTTTK